MLTLTVRRLERDGLVLRTVYPTVPAQVDYRLTETGASLTHLVKALADWSLEHRVHITRARETYDSEHPDNEICLCSPEPGSGTDLGESSRSVTSLFDCEKTSSRETAYALSPPPELTLPQVRVGHCRGQMLTVMVLVMQTDAPFWDSLVFDGIDEVDIEAVTAAFGTVEVMARGRAVGAACPDCGRFSDRVHGRYQRRLKDLPLAEQGFVIRLTVRRFICGVADCPRRTFAEPFSRLAAPHARFTTRLNHALEQVGLALAGRAGARLAAQLGFGAVRMTLLRRIMALPDPRFSTPRVLGVDDFAIRRGQTYSTVLTSVEDHHVVDVLPTREAGPLATWLIQHPGVEVICRDRAGAYAEGARRGAPDALQVADRFHLWQGLGRAVDTCVAAHRECLRNPSPTGTLAGATSPGRGMPQNDSAPLGRRAERKKAAHALVHELLAQGHSRRAIARHLGWGLNTVLRYANATRWQDTIRENRPRPSRLDPYKPYLERRFAEGCTSVTRLHGELIAANAPVTYQMVRAHIANLRGAPAGAAPRPPSVRQVTGWLTRHPTALTEEDRAGLKEVLARCPELEKAAGLVRDFGEILTDRLGSTLPAWINAVDASQLPGLTGFALHLLRDLDAVTAGLTLDWSSGSIEGAVNRIKKIKRQLYGRAGFELLRKMILLQWDSKPSDPSPRTEMTAPWEARWGVSAPTDIMPLWT